MYGKLLQFWDGRLLMCHDIFHLHKISGEIEMDGIGSVPQHVDYNVI